MARIRDLVWGPIDCEVPGWIGCAVGRAIFLGVPTVLIVASAMGVAANGEFTIDAVTSEMFSQTTGVMLVLIPALFTLMLVVSLRQLAAQRRRERLAPLCQRCGYSLKGLSSSRCPECGSPFDREVDRPASPKLSSDCTEGCKNENA